MHHGTLDGEIFDEVISKDEQAAFMYWDRETTSFFFSLLLLQVAPILLLEPEVITISVSLSVGRDKYKIIKPGILHIPALHGLTVVGYYPRRSVCRKIQCFWNLYQN